MLHETTAAFHAQREGIAGNSRQRLDQSHMRFLIHIAEEA